MVAKVLKFLSKVAVGGGAVYVTLQQDVWSNSSSGSQALTNVKGSVLISADDYTKKIPTVNDVNDTVLSYWNSGVKTAFGGLSSTPSLVGEYSKKAVSSLTSS